MNVRAIVDTNVLVSVFWTKNRASLPSRILDALLSRAFIPLYSPEIIAEYREVLARSQFGFDGDAIESLLDAVVAYGEPALRAESDEAFPDPEDKVFYCVALTRAEDAAKLVTGNARHYPKSPFVLTPAEFCALLGI